MQLIVGLKLCMCLMSLALISGPLPAVQAREIIHVANETNMTTGLFVIRLGDSVTQSQFDEIVQNVTVLAKDKKVYARVNGTVANLFTMRLTEEEATIVSTNM